MTKVISFAICPCCGRKYQEEHQEDCTIGISMTLYSIEPDPKHVKRFKKVMTFHMLGQTIHRWLTFWKWHKFPPWKSNRWPNWHKEELKDRLP